ncbi:hypothetical protein [Entomobacter blattae]|uniref:Uncharacterized protein n=1 Tax=Entomobacter blattae TaxID=2762277 RepID=A0A7H1NUP9_9PROT|nr:hypothetical protein [Entomobacter blattae]QNT79509.1 hypothetical protein JGUZn3_23080 [Entomobacter blattae]
MGLSIKRFALAGLATAGLLNSGAMAASQCKPAPAKEAFQVQGLKSELMVTALTCNAQDKYNAFVAKFRSFLSAEENTLDNYFRKTYGRRAKTQHDDYITQLANVQSAEGLKSGTIFCLQRTSMFDEVAALETAEDLSNYAEAKNIVQPISYEICEAPTSSSSSSSKHHRVRKHSTRARKA